MSAAKAKTKNPPKAAKPAPATAVEEHGEHEHPSDWQYIKIGLILAALTGIEVALYYVNIGAANTPVLLVLAVLKFAIVAAYFMHLKFDNAILRRLFITGIVLAIGVYIAYLLMLGVFI